MSQGTQSSTKRGPLIVAFFVLAGAAAGATWWRTDRGGPARDLMLYGNVDLRQVARTVRP
jgi:hypothetical protein